MEKLSLKEVEYVAHQLAQQTMEWSEPIPDFATRYGNKLESCLATPFQTYARKHLYKGVFGRSSILFYLMIKNHPFQNGNKRIAMTTLVYFLYKNGKLLKVDNILLYNFTKWVAASDPAVNDATVLAIEMFLKKYVVNI